MDEVGLHRVELAIDRVLRRRVPVHLVEVVPLPAQKRMPLGRPPERRVGAFRIRVVAGLRLVQLEGVAVVDQHHRDGLEMRLNPTVQARPTIRHEARLHVDRTLMAPTGTGAAPRFLLSGVDAIIAGFMRVHPLALRRASHQRAQMQQRGERRTSHRDAVRPPIRLRVGGRASTGWRPRVTTWVEFAEITRGGRRRWRGARRARIGRPEHPGTTPHYC